MQPDKPAPRAAIIMPAYNAAGTIENTVRSILAQTLGELVLIAVDDGSTDETAAILARLAREDGRVLPVTVPNGGPAAARNHGLTLVPKGTEYLMFSDADDLLAPDALAYAVEHADGADLVLMGFTIRQPDGSRVAYAEPEAVYTPETLGAALGRLYKANLLNQVWGKLFRADLVLENGLRFVDYRWGEDRIFVGDCLARARKVAVLPALKYEYIMYPGESLITRWYDRKLEACILAARHMEALCRKLGVRDMRDFNYMFMKSVFSCMTTLFSPRCALTRGQKRAEIRRVVTEPYVRAHSRDVFGGFAVQALCAVVRTGSVPLNYLVFGLVARVGTLAPKLFTALKHRK